MLVFLNWCAVTLVSSMRSYVIETSLVVPKAFFTWKITVWLIVAKLENEFLTLSTESSVVKSTPSLTPNSWSPGYNFW